MVTQSELLRIDRIESACYLAGSFDKLRTMTGLLMFVVAVVATKLTVNRNTVSINYNINSTRQVTTFVA